MNDRLAAALGVALAAVGLAALALPALTTGLPVDELLVAGLGGLLTLGALREVRRRRTTERVYAEPPPVERTVDLPTPGEEFDERLARLPGLVDRTVQHNHLRREVGDAAVATLRRRFGMTESEARTALRDGTWTEDPFAAAFLRDGPPDVGRVERVRELLRSESAFRHRLDRALAELSRVAEGDIGSEEDDDDGG